MRGVGPIALLTAVVALVVLLAAPGVAAQSGDSWTVDTEADWNTGAFNETDTWGGEIALTADPVPNWNTTTPDDGMMVDVNNSYSDTHMVYTVDEDSVYMANQSTGNVLWSSTDGQDNFLDTAAIGPQFVYSGNDSNAWVHDFSGTEIYSPNPSNCCKEAIVPGPSDYFYIGNESGLIGVYRKSDGTEAFGHAVQGFATSSLYVDQGGNYLYRNNNSHTQVYSGIPSSLNLEESWPMPNGGIDNYDTDSVYADGDFFYFSGDNGNVSVAEKGTWNYIANISVTGADVWSVDSDERHVYYAAHDGNLYIHKKSRSEGFPLVETVDVGEGSRANSVDGNDERIFHAVDDDGSGGTVGALDKHADGGNYTNTNDWSGFVKHNNVTVDASINSEVNLTLRSDTDDDGAFEDSTTVAVQDGNNTYDVSALANGIRTQSEFQMGVSPGESTPIVGFLSVAVSSAPAPAPGTGDCVNHRDLSRGQESQECPDDRDISRGGSRDEFDRSTGRDSDTSRRDRGRGSR